MSNHVLQTPVPLFSLSLLYNEIFDRVALYNRQEGEEHQLTLHMVPDNVIRAEPSAMQNSFGDFPGLKDSVGIWCPADKSKDWEVIIKVTTPLRLAEFTLNARGRSAFDTPLHEKPRSPSAGRELVRLTYVLQSETLVASRWRTALSRPEKSPYWRSVIDLLAALGQYELWRPIVDALEQGRACIPLRDNYKKSQV